MKYQVTRLDENLASATSTLISGRPDCRVTLGETNSLLEAIKIGHNANETRTEGDGGARVDSNNKVVINPVDIPLAYRSLSEFNTERERNFPAATDTLTIKKLHDRMDEYHFGVELA